ncbi:MAG TPA: FAD-binding oxidoreductase [Rhabdaerophilum sp.]|nr:FAD-binding oxidoreductase [Rhabdaerophilum sp.]
MTEILIIGGGIIGCASAYHLARRGQRVRLIESRNLAAMASGWTLGGVRQSGRDPAELPLARAAVARWQELSDELDADTGYHRDGNLRLARTPDEVEAIRSMVTSQRALGLTLDFLPDANAVRAIAPAIGSNVLAASFCASDGYADPTAATLAFASAACRHGARIEEGFRAIKLAARGERIAGAETSGGFISADRVIVATGTHSAGLLAPLGVVLPLTIMQVQVALSTPAEHVFRQVFGVANADCAGRQQPDGRFRYTSGIGPYPDDPEQWTAAALAPDRAAMEALRQRIGGFLPALADPAIEQRWGGLIDMTPDALPVISPVPTLPGLLIAAGFSGHGFGIAPAVGEAVAALALDEPGPFDLSPFRLDRFIQGAAPAPMTLHG